MQSGRITSFGDEDAPWMLAEEDIARQAIGSLRGYVYQLHQSASARIGLAEDSLLQLEVAEDFSRILARPRSLDAILEATQVKDTRESGRVTLNSPDVLDAMRSLHRLRANNPGREVRLTFLTTSEIGKEQKDPLPSGVSGIDAWAQASGGGPCSEIRAALLNRLEQGEFRHLVESSTDEQLRAALIAPLIFVCGAGSWCDIERDNRRALIDLADELQSTPEMASRAYDSVFGHIIRTILSSETRTLDRRDLISLLLISS